MTTNANRKQRAISAVLHNKPKLEAIRNHHYAKGNIHMSMTRVLETLIDREFKRLKLCETATTSES